MRVKEGMPLSSPLSPHFSLLVGQSPPCQRQRDGCVHEQGGGGQPSLHLSRTTIIVIIAYINTY